MTAISMSYWMCASFAIFSYVFEWSRRPFKTRVYLKAFLRQSTWRHFGSRLHLFWRSFSKHKLISGMESLKSGFRTPVCFPRVCTRPLSVFEWRMHLSRDCSNVYPTHSLWIWHRYFLWNFRMITHTVHFYYIKIYLLYNLLLYYIT